MSLISAPAGVQQPQRGPAWGGIYTSCPAHESARPVLQLDATRDWARSCPHTLGKASASATQYAHITQACAY